MIQSSWAVYSRAQVAAGNGYRDLHGLHAMPSITVDSDASGDPYNFDIIARQATHTALVDNDPTYGQHYAALNQEWGDKVLALNMDLDQAIDASG